MSRPKGLGWVNTSMSSCTRVDSLQGGPASVPLYIGRRSANTCPLHSKATPYAAESMSPFAHQMLAVFMHTLAIYVFLIVSLRVLGRRQLGQMTVVDLVVIII